MEQKTVFGKWGVFIIGLLMAAMTALQPLVTGLEADAQTYILAASIAALSFIAREWRGKGVTVFGLVSVAAGAMAIELESGKPINWYQLAFFIMLKVLSAVAPPPKPDSYEHNIEIVRAKQEPPIKSEQVADPNNVKIN